MKNGKGESVIYRRFIVFFYLKSHGTRTSLIVIGRPKSGMSNLAAAQGRVRFPRH